MKRLLFVSLFFLSLMALQSCADKLLNIDATEEVSSKSNLRVGTILGTHTVDLMAGKHIKIGTVSISNDSDFLYVTLSTKNNWVLGKTHLYVGSMAKLPVAKAGNPKIGNFPYSQVHAPLVNTYTYTLPLAGLDPCFVVAAHAEALLLDNNGTVIQKETAWGAGKLIAKKGSWATATEYCVTLTNPLEDGLIAHYKFDGNVLDASGNDHHGKFISTATTPVLVADRFGSANAAYKFDGSNDYIEVADHTDLRLSGTDYTISAWVKIDEAGNSPDNTIFSKRSGCGNRGYLFHITDNLHDTEAANTVVFNVSGCDAPKITAPSTTTYGNWHHIALVYTLSDSKMTIYLDETPVISQSIPSPNAAEAAKLFIGKDGYTSAWTPSHFFKGSMDEIRIYGRALSQAEVTMLGE